jgi:hypothetical protein
MIRNPQQPIPSRFIGLEFPDMFGLQRLQRSPSGRFDFNPTHEPGIQNTIMLYPLHSKRPSRTEEFILYQRTTFPQQRIFNT